MSIEWAGGDGGRYQHDVTECDRHAYRDHVEWIVFALYGLIDFSQKNDEWIQETNSFWQ
jgi:hypothetical protein